MNGASNPLYGKLFIEGVIRCQSGLHIGGGREKFEIGGLDTPVMRDPVSNEPYIPGSSFRGKLRSLLERSEEGWQRQQISDEILDPAEKQRRLRELHKNYYKKTATLGGKPVRIHLCAKRDCRVCRLFGSVPMPGEGQNAARDKEDYIPSPLLVRDLPMLNLKGLRTKLGSDENYTERKMENVLDRITAHANPREIERVPRATAFTMRLVYDICTPERERIEKDCHTIIKLLNLLQDSSLGGHGVRGYGEVKVELTAVYGRPLAYYQNHISNTAGQAGLEIRRTVQELTGLPEPAEPVDLSKRIENQEDCNIRKIDMANFENWIAEVLNTSNLPEPELPEPVTTDEDE